VEFVAVYTHNSALLAVLSLMLLNALIISWILTAYELRVISGVIVKAELCLIFIISNMSCDGSPSPFLEGPMEDSPDRLD